MADALWVVVMVRSMSQRKRTKMSKYIDSEAFFKAINTLPYKDTSYPDTSAYNGAISDVADMLTHFPAADVQEVRHGRWRLTELGDSVYKCSNCGFIRDSYLLEEDAFCPHCGAKMNKVE